MKGDQHNSIQTWTHGLYKHHFNTTVSWILLISIQDYVGTGANCAIEGFLSYPDSVSVTRSPLPFPFWSYNKGNGSSSAVNSQTSRHYLTQYQPTNNHDVARRSVTSARAQRPSHYSPPKKTPINSLGSRSRVISLPFSSQPMPPAPPQFPETQTSVLSQPCYWNLASLEPLLAFRKPCTEAFDLPIC